jgi:transposase
MEFTDEEAKANMSAEQLKAALVKVWKKHSQLKKEMAPLLSDLRKALRKQGSRKGEGWGAWVEAGHIGISLKTANRWANEYEGKTTSSQKSRSGLKARAAEAQVVAFIKSPRPSWMTDEKKKQLDQAIEIVGDQRALQLFFDAVTQAAAQQASRANEAMATHA